LAGVQSRPIARPNSRRGLRPLHEPLEELGLHRRHADRCLLLARGKARAFRYFGARTADGTSMLVLRGLDLPEQLAAPTDRASLDVHAFASPLALTPLGGEVGDSLRAAHLRHGRVVEARRQCDRQALRRGEDRRPREGGATPVERSDHRSWITVRFRGESPDIHLFGSARYRHATKSNPARRRRLTRPRTRGGAAVNGASSSPHRRAARPASAFSRARGPPDFARSPCGNSGFPRSRRTNAGRPPRRPGRT